MQYHRLDPNAEHPYEYWRNKNGSMWVADFLGSEGFDGARILVWGVPTGKGKLEAEISKVWLGDNPTILVEIPKEPSAPLFRRVSSHIPLRSWETQSP